jgi:hypothetical protein
VRDLGVAAGAGELEDRLLVPVQAQPFEALEDLLDRVLGAARAVGILDAQEEPAALGRAVRAPPIWR